MEKREYQSPSDLCRGTDFWMLNDELEDEELKKQMYAMREQGIASVIVRTYIGLRSDYPGRDWMAHMHTIVDTARETGIRLFMQAGYMPEAVLDLPEKYSLGNISVSLSGRGEGVVLDTWEGKEYCLKPSGIILDMLNREACDFYVYQSYENMWKEFREEYGKTIASVWVDEPSFAKAQLPWTERLPETYRQLWNEDFPMNRLHELFEKTGDYRTLRLRFWRTVLYMMEHAYFQAIHEWGEKNGVMISGHLMEEDTMKKQIRATCFTMPMYRFFDIPGIDYLTCAMDWVHGEIKPEYPYEKNWTQYGVYNTPLQCTSAAHQAGKDTILAEMYGVSTENLSFRDQKYIYDRFASMGINQRSVHGIFYSLRGRGKRAYPPHINTYQPYWEQYHLLTDTLARETAFLRTGSPVRDLLLIHPIETAFSLFDAEGVDGIAKNPEIERLDAEFNACIRDLTSMQANFKLGDEDTLARIGRVLPDGNLKVGAMAYSAVILPYMDVIRKSTLELLRQMLERNLRVFFYGVVPFRVDDGNPFVMEQLPGSKFISGSRALWETVNGLPAAFRYVPLRVNPYVQIHYREQGKRRLFFLANTDCREEACGEIRVSGHMTALEFDAYSGELIKKSVHQDAQNTYIPVQIPAGESLMLELNPGDSTDAPEAERARIVLPVRSAWRVKRNEENVLVLEMFRFARSGEQLSESTYPVSALQSILEKEHYRGMLTLQTVFSTALSLKGLTLAVEQPGEILEIDVDGKPIDTVPVGQFHCRAFRVLRLPALEAGKHVLTLKRMFEEVRKSRTAVTALFENLGGTELEPVLVLGDFAVQSHVEPGIRGCIRLNEDFVLTAENGLSRGLLTEEGYPFYCGSMQMETEFLWDGGANGMLEIGELDASVCKVTLNGMDCGALWREGKQLKLSGLRTGINTIKLVLYGTMRNLLGPWHRTVGEIGACWGGYEEPNLPWTGAWSHENRSTVPEWYEHRKPDRDGWTEAYLMLPFGINDLKVCGYVR